MKEGWRIVKLGEVCDRFGEYGMSVSSKPYDGIRYIRITDITDDGNLNDDYVSADINYIDDDYRLQKGDVLFARTGATVGKTFVYKEEFGECVYAGYLIRYRPNLSLVLPQFLFYCTHYQEYYNWVKNNQKAAAQPNISAKLYNGYELSLPPLEEQHRIVSILDASFEKIDALKKNAEENLKNAKALFLQVLAQELKPKEGWGKYELENICTNIIDCPHSTPKKSDAITNYPCIRTSELRNGKIYWDSMQYLDKDEYEKRVVRLIPKEGDIVYGREGTFGDAVLLPSGYNFSLGQRTMLLRPDTTIVCPEFLLITMISPYVYKQAKDKNSGCGVGHVNVKDIKKFTIYLPDDISEQHRIVRTLDILSEKCRRLEQIAQQTIRECDALKQSILRQAFSGEL